MKASTVRALRLPVLILLVFGLLAAGVVIFSVRLGAHGHLSDGQNTVHLENAIGLDLVNTSGQHFVIDDLFVTGDKLDLRYHARGVVAMNSGEPPPLQCRTQSPTIINVASDGNFYIPYDATIGGQQGSTTVQGEFIWTFTGKPPHHLDISVVRVLCDTNASWTIHVDN